MMKTIKKFFRSMKDHSKRILKHRANRRELARTKRWMKDRAEGRLVVALYGNGMIRRRV